jgi:hypothetical protein
MTYNDEAADSHQVVEDILLPWELGVARLQLTQVLIRPHGVDDESYFRAAEQERRHEPPYLRRESE